ncbi:glycosyltransferase [Aestuariirhabdus sp. Z084]|uniref:glycosyltransferase n=1 Tax=Aestuariirhabdus haliotis TaxID=2918751 RepID=UPI0020BE44BC|nr:glycosyltransferase [Aestuariirhabdus haliotis]MCL6415803.1 glycosyltransferase [Aestuariirhabdus haliotis]
MKIFHGIENVAGIGGYLSGYQKKKGLDSEFIVLCKNKFFDNHDKFVFVEENLGFFSRISLRFKLFFYAVNKFDVYNFYFSSTLLPFSLDLPILRMLGKKVVMIYCGSEVRLVEVERSRNEFWSIIEPELKSTLDDVVYDKYKKIRMIWQGFWCHKLLAPRNLYDHVVGFVPKKKIVSDLWVHNLSSYRNPVSVGSDKEGSLLRIVHIPSSPRVKGTHYFRSAVAELKSEGYCFDYKEVTNVSHFEAMSQLAEADIVLDQLLIGGFGSLSVEAMSYGKPVVCYLIDSVKSQHYADCPIVNANIFSVKDRIKELIVNDKLRMDLGKKGKAYSDKYFNFVQINESMLSLYQELRCD